MEAVLSRLGHALAALVFSAPCPLCGAGGHGGRICGDCFAALPRLDEGSGCAVCAEPLASDAGRCAACRVGRAFDSAHALGPFRGSLREAVLQVKYRGHRSLAHDLGRRVGVEIASSMPELDVIVPMPLARRRQRERGYNQAARIAGGLASTLGVRCSERLLRRVRDTESQARLTRAARLTNVQAAFRGSKRVAGRSVLLVDDVLTTGATADSAARALRVAGAASVHVVVLARAEFDALAADRESSPDECA